MLLVEQLISSLCLTLSGAISVSQVTVRKGPFLKHYCSMALLLPWQVNLVWKS